MISSDSETSFTLSTTSSERAARSLLVELSDRLAATDLTEHTRGTVEIVMAEAINNVVEHAYGPEGSGPVTLAVEVEPAQLCFVLCDNGSPLKGLELPPGDLPNHDVPVDSLPEGGFGWFLIRKLTSELNYAHEKGENRLSLKIPKDQANP